MIKWQLDELISSLKENCEKDSSWHQWALTQREENRQEYYLIQSAEKGGVDLDQSRGVTNLEFKLRLYVKKAEGQLGFAEGSLIREWELVPQLESLKQKALLGSEELWSFPNPISSNPLKASEESPQKIYAPLLDDLSGCAFQIYQDLGAAIRVTSMGQFNSAELFVIHERLTVVLSSGFTRVQDESKIYAEVCFSATDDNSSLSEEFLVTRWASHPEQLNFTQMCQESSTLAEASLRTKKASSDSYSVILHKDALNILLHDLLAQLRAQRKYYRMPFKEKDSPLIENFSGNPFALKLDPTLDFCFASQAYSGEGWPQRILELARDNQVLSHMTSHQMAQYLGEKPSSTEGCLVIEPERVLSKEALVQSQPRVLEILQFSALSCSDMDLTFSSEIRLARLYDRETGEISYIKGGNLSGHLPTNFAQVQWGGDLMVENYLEYSGAGMSYFGPELALINNVRVSS